MNCSLLLTVQRENCREVKEKVCYSALHYQEELKTSESSSDKEVRYELPDGNTVVVNKERFQAAEALFDPSLIGIRLCFFILDSCSASNSSLGPSDQIRRICYKVL